jgi:ubiquitin C-terminal hydrolase
MAFDKVENGLRGTTMKYLTQSIFYGQTCSQIICQECGNVKNRLEDYSNLSLTIKNLKSVHDSLTDLIKAETISDFECEKCEKKVDIQKRTLISSTPSVLFVHLQRLVFNFDTFNNDKVNTLCEYPDILDLKPYSFYHIMQKEGRLGKKQANAANADDSEEEIDEDEKAKRAEEEKSWPAEETCYEYKLVGATIHSGTANAGHYWSYINTKRGMEEVEESEDWVHTDSDPWMEFNDSTVRDLDYKKVGEDGFGGEST